MLAAAILALGFLPAGCGQSGAGAVKTAIASLSASGAVPPAAATTAPAPTSAAPAPTSVFSSVPTAAPSSAAPSSAAPSTAQTLTTAPPTVSSATAPAASTEPKSPLLWLWLGLGALVFIGIVWLIAHTSARHRAARAAWQSQIIDAYATGAALQDAMSAAEAPGALERPGASARWAEIQRRADDFNQKLYAMRAAAPDEQSRAAIVDVITSLQAVRSAMDAQHVPGGAGGAQAEVVRERLLAYEASLRALRSPHTPQP